LQGRNSSVISRNFNWNEREVITLKKRNEKKAKRQGKSKRFSARASKILNKRFNRFWME